VRRTLLPGCFASFGRKSPPSSTAIPKTVAVAPTSRFSFALWHCSSLSLTAADADEAASA
jgi:hypothetical protein